MSIKALENLVKIGQLKPEASAQSEIDTHLQSGRDRLRDACADGISLSGKFLLGYSAAYAFSLAALRRHGYRPVNRYVVFQCLPHTLFVGPEYGACWPLPMMCAMVLNMKEAMKLRKTSATRSFSAQRLWRRCFRNRIDS